MMPAVNETGGNARPLVLFDGACPMCSREIAHYRRLRGAEAVEWLDIAAGDAPEQVDGVSKAEAMARFHVRDIAGRWHSGAYGFVELWTHLPGYRWLARLLRLTRTTALLDRAYVQFARWRLARQHGPASCQACVVASADGDADGPRAGAAANHRQATETSTPS